MDAIYVIGLAAKLLGCTEEAIALHGHLASHKYPARDTATDAALDTLQTRIAALDPRTTQQSRLKRTSLHWKLKSLKQAKA